MMPFFYLRLLNQDVALVRPRTRRYACQLLYPVELLTGDKSTTPVGSANNGRHYRRSQTAHSSQGAVRFAPYTRRSATTRTISTQANGRSGECRASHTSEPPPLRRRGQNMRQQYRSLFHF